MYRVYIGNVDSDVTEEILRSLLVEHGLVTTSVVLKRGYAFVDCPDSESFDQTINQLNGCNLLGTTLQVEASSISKRLRTSCVEVSRLPRDVGNDSVLQLVARFGHVHQCDIVEDPSDPLFNIAIVDYGTWQHARQAFEGLDDLEFEGSTLKVQFVTDSDTASSTVHDPVSMSMSTASSHLQHGLPVRMLVPSDFIGAVIGRKGQTIRNITAQSKARIDVHGKENTGLMEKLVI